MSSQPITPGLERFQFSLKQGYRQCPESAEGVAGYWRSNINWKRFKQQAIAKRPQHKSRKGQRPNLGGRCPACGRAKALLCEGLINQNKTTALPAEITAAHAAQLYQILSRP